MLSNRGQCAVLVRGTLRRDGHRSELALSGPRVGVALVVVAGVAFGAAVTVGTGAMLLALSLVPPAIVLLLWPGVQPLTAAEVLHGRDRRA